MTLNNYCDVTVLKFLVTFAIPKDKNDQNYENVVLKSSINACKMFQGITGDFISKMIMDDFKPHVDVDLKCPFKQGLIHVTNFGFNDKYLPIYMLAENVTFTMMINATGKVPNSKGLVYLFTTKMFGKITRN